MTMQGVITDVERREIQKRDGTGSMILFDVVLGDGSKWTAFEEPLARQAWDARGKTVSMEVSVTQKGNYTNKNLRAILGAGVATPTNGGFPTQTTSFGATESQFPTQTETFSPSPEGTNLSAKDASIYRQVATKVSAIISKSELDFWANVDTLVRFYETGDKPNLLDGLINSGQVQVGTGQVQTEATAPFHGEPPPRGDDDIPF